MKKEIALNMYGVAHKKAHEEEKRLCEEKLKEILKKTKLPILMQIMLSEEDAFLLGMEWEAFGDKFIDYHGSYAVKTVKSLLPTMPLDTALLLAKKSKDPYISSLAKKRANELFDASFEEFIDKEQDLVDDMIKNRKKSRHLKIREEYILKIRKFISNYVLPKEKDKDKTPKILEKEKITHEDLREYVTENHLPLRRVRFEAFEKQLECNGTFLIVKDERGQKIPYLNPLLRERQRLQDHVIKSVPNKEKEDTFLETLKEADFTITLQDYFPNEFYLEAHVTEKVNRNKRQLQYSKRGIRYKGGKRG